MKKLLLSIALVGLLGITPVFAIDDAIIAVVNDEVITLKDLREYMNGIYSQLKLEGKDPFEVDEIMHQYEEKGIQKLIDDRLILSRANEIGLEVRKSAVEDRIKEIQAAYPSEQAFLETLSKEGVSISDIQKKVSDQMKARFIVDREVKNKIFVYPNEVTDFYNANPTIFKKAPSVKLDSIFLSFEQGKSVALEKAKEAKRALDRGEDFKRVASQFSDAPSVGVIEKGSMISRVEDVVFKMNEGEISDLVQVDNGVFIFKLLKTFDAEELPLEDVKDKINQKLFQDKFKEQFDQWLADLRAKAYVEVK